MLNNTQENKKIIQLSNYKNASSIKEKLDRLCELGILSSDQSMIALTEYRYTMQPIEKILVYLGFVTENTLTTLISEDTGVHSISIKKTVLDSKVVQKLPRNIAEKFCIIPIDDQNNILTLCMTDINDIRAKDEAKKYFNNHKIREVLASRTDIVEAINKYYQLNTSLELILKEFEKDDKKIHDSSNYTSPTVRFVNAIILDAVKKNASDIHFEPEKFFVRVRYRIDGMLIQSCVFHKNYWNQICVRIKIISNIDIADSIRPHNGRFTMNLIGRDIDFRVSSHPISHGENIVIRVLDKKNFLISLNELGYEEHSMKILHSALEKKDGVIIVTGPTGSGKTTSLYAMLSIVQSEKVNVMTLEDPIEYELPVIRQSSIQDIEGRQFTDGLRSILRQDPDIIFIGEIRDATTAETAIRSSMTGHQVFTTLHTQNALGAVFRLIDLGISPSLIAGNVSAIIAQRLVRKLCDKCKINRKPTETEKKMLRIDRNKSQNSFLQNTVLQSIPTGMEKQTIENDDYKKRNIQFAAEESHEYETDETEITICDSNGCEDCNYTGYHGRTCISEVLNLNKYINEAIYNKKSLTELMKIANENGFSSMKQNGIRLILSGQTTIAELTRVIDLIDV